MIRGFSPGSTPVAHPDPNSPPPLNERIGRRVTKPTPDWLPYVLPMATFLILTSLEGYLASYPLAYAIKMVVVTLVVIACRSTWRDLRPLPTPAGWALAIGLGVAVAVAWVGLDGYYPTFKFLGGERSAYDPNVLSPAAKVGFLAMRLYGLVLLVPLFEELFWRSFGIRYVIDPDFTKVPLGKMTPMAAAITSVVFALAHPIEWLPALLTGLAWAWLVHRTRSITACVVSHMVANLGLGIYVLTTHQWKFW
jgi:CAAX prenyl protease-like protein